MADSLHRLTLASLAAAAVDNVERLSAFRSELSFPNRLACTRQLLISRAPCDCLPALLHEAFAADGPVIVEAFVDPQEYRQLVLKGDR